MKVFTSKCALACPITVLVLIAMLSGCGSHEPTTDPFFDYWKSKAEVSKPYTPSQAPVASATAPPSGAAKANPAAPLHPGADAPPLPADLPIDLPKTPLSVRFIDDDLATSLRTMARIANQNILISPSVQGKLNLQTQDTPWDTVFLGIINSYGLTVVKDNNLLHVMAMADLKQQVERKSLQLQEQQVSTLVTKIVPIEFSDPKTIVDSVSQLLSKDKDGKARGSVSMDQHSRSLIIRETEDSIERMLSLVRELDRPTSQILIEAHIVETTKDTARELGIQWGGITSPHGDASTLLATGSGTATYDASRLNQTPPLSPFQYTTKDLYAVNLAASAIKGINPASIGVLIEAGDGILAAQLSALQRNGKLNILSSPSIATLDNAEAVIESGKSVPFQTIEDGKTQITYKDATLNLTVVPHVISDRMIKLNIEAKKDEVDTSNTVAGNPFIIKKLAKTQLIVENNATVVLAGLSKETNSGSNSGVPGLKDVPGLGWLFKKDSSNREFEELLIFITPKILTNPGTPTASGGTQP